MDHVVSAALASELPKSTMGIQQSRRLVLYAAFAMVKALHVSRDRFIHTHFAPTCGALSLRLSFVTRQRNFDKNLSLKTGVLVFLSPF